MKYEPGGGGKLLGWGYFGGFRIRRLREAPGSGGADLTQESAVATDPVLERGGELIDVTGSDVH